MEDQKLWIQDGEWQQYEAYVLGALQRRFVGAKITRNTHLPGLKTGKPRQIDILVEATIGGLNLVFVFDCKFYKRKVDVNDVEAFLGMLDDIRVSKGVLVTTKGYSDAARARIGGEPRDVDLQVLAPERLSQYQHIGCAILWRGPVAAVVGPMKGWVTDNEKTGKDGRPQFSMYPLGHTLESAARLSPFIYGNIIVKREDQPTMEAIAAAHEKAILDKLPDARFERLPVTEDLGHTQGSVLFRVGQIAASYNGPEYSVYLDFEGGVLLLVLLCPEGEDQFHVPVLTQLAREALLMRRVEPIDLRP